jgi:hippurate hydrolase
LIATAEILANKSEAWRGTAFICAQPGEETGQGAEAMLRDGLFKRFRGPTFVLDSTFCRLPLERLVIMPV